MEKTSIQFRFSTGAGTDNSLGLRRGFFETEQQGKLKARYHPVTDLKTLLPADSTD